MSGIPKELIEQQINHYLYKRADELHSKTKLEQLTKAANKYPEPLEPDHWSALQCGRHAFQELIDLEHYVTMQLIKNERLEENIKELEQENKELKQQIKEQTAAALRAIRKAYCYGR
jgi:predicted phage-related endonuclease